MDLFIPGLRNVALGLSRRPLVNLRRPLCISCRLRPTHSSTRFKTSKPIAQRIGLQPPVRKTLNSIKTSLSVRISRASSTAFVAESATGIPRSTFDTPRIARFFPAQSANIVGYWLVGCAVSVFGIVVFGGLTRLTESGLSITEWKPVTGSLPPFNNEAWEVEFAKYRASPEFKLLNPHMTLPEFKRIYFMEWAHRLWGRAIGISLVLPAIYFMARREVSAQMSIRLLGIAGIIAFQGMVGWWMVKSGLKNDLFTPGSHPRVSQYRLTAHLGAAFICYTAMLSSGLAILSQDAIKERMRFSRSLYQLRRWVQGKSTIFRSQKSHRKLLTALGLLVFVTAMSGGLVAGLDAGMIYNEFPRMGQGYLPPASELMSEFYSRTPGDLWWRNMLENPTMVQLQHRFLAVTTYSSIMALAFVTYARSKLTSTVVYKANKIHFRPYRRVVYLLAALANLQALLGISTLIYMVPVPLAALHQAGSLALLTTIVFLRSRYAFDYRSYAKLLYAQRKKLWNPSLAKSQASVVGRGGPASTKPLPESQTPTLPRITRTKSGLRHPAKITAVSSEKVQPVTRFVMS